MRWNKKYDIMIKDDKLYMIVFHNERMRPLFMRIEIEESGFVFIKGEVLLPENMRMENAGRGFGNKLIRV